MDGYRPTLLGRALADALQALETDGELHAHESDALFALFDDVMRSELQPESKELFTHRSMELQGTARSFNRFMDQWTVHAALPPDGVRLDGVPAELAMDHVAEADLLIKLHGQPAKPKKKHK